MGSIRSSRIFGIVTLLKAGSLVFLMRTECGNRHPLIYRYVGKAVIILKTRHVAIHVRNLGTEAKKPDS
ncbi:hypothetical protein SAMN05444955_11718 [Lihuaxuella thermophila]|uniref:Uncharacterized protein n=1 Tax=Lihuaxuella thermophila TaxID=1173111 RepID=A0A1H8ICK3_9BACL|nr:hypothetical protein SAMN05444955_11718 [Lihuaxuella thermophila]